MKLVILGAATFVAAAALSTAASAGECRDPWVTTAIYELTGHKPRGSGETLDCNIKLYGGGQWSSYPDLFAKVKASYRDPMPQAGIAPGANGARIAGGANGAGIAAGANAARGAGVIARDGAGLVGNDGSTLRGNGLVAAGGGN